MPQNTNLNVSPYFDDFVDSKNYQKVLFKPGFPVQARELTTLQSILQNQIEKFGQHFFKEGSMVIPGGTSYDSEYNSVKINPNFLNIPVSNYTKIFADNRIKIKGEQTHGSTPWSGIDPIMATAELIEALNTIVSRRINIINNPAVISVGLVKAGTRNNIIPEDSMIMGTIRTFDPDLRKTLLLFKTVPLRSDTFLYSWSLVQMIWRYLKFLMLP